LQKVYDLEVRWTAFPLHPETPEEGRTLEQLFAGRLDINLVMARLRQAAQEAGLPFADHRRMTYNSRLAQELSKWVESKGKGDLFHRRVFEAYFVQGLNIGKIPILTELVRTIGLSPDEAADVLQKRLYKETVDLDWARSRSMGIQAVPSFMLDEKVMVGAQPYEKLEAFVTSAGVIRRNDMAR
jgi:predicted DsbA family dithiol-disulfide isomerase